MTSTERQAFIEEVRDNLEGAKKHDACDDWLIENRHKMAKEIALLSDYTKRLLDENIEVFAKMGLQSAEHKTEVAEWRRQALYHNTEHGKKIVEIRAFAMQVRRAFVIVSGARPAGYESAITQTEAILEAILEDYDNEDILKATRIA